MKKTERDPIADTPQPTRIYERQKHPTDRTRMQTWQLTRKQSFPIVLLNLNKKSKPGRNTKKIINLLVNTNLEAKPKYRLNEKQTTVNIKHALNWKVISQLNLTLIRPHSDYHVDFWSPYHTLNVNSLSSIQERMRNAIKKTLENLQRAAQTGLMKVIQMEN